MGKKLKKDFKERQRARIEKERLQSNGSIEPEESKLKHSDDYRGKIVHDKDRFQDKVHEKVSKRSEETELNGKTSKRNARYRSPETGSVSQEEIGKADYDTEVKDGKIYDPLGKDLDNDGIIDRYDNDFRDSDYFESSYDVEGLNKQEITGGDISEHNAQKKLYKRKNYVESLYTRKKDDISNADKQKEEFESSANSKKAIYKNKNKLSKAEKQSLKSSSIKVSALSGLAKGSEVVRDYLSNGSDENQGVEAAEKIADGNSKLLHGIKNYSNIKKVKKGYNLSKKDYKIRKHKSKLEFREAKEELKKTDEYKKAHAFKKFQKRRQMKKTIRKQNKSRLRDRIKEEVVNVLKSLKEIIVRKAKGLMIIIIGLIILGIFFINFAGTSMTGMINSASGVLATSYLSDKNVLSEVNQQFKTWRKAYKMS